MINNCWFFLMPCAIFLSAWNLFKVVKDTRRGINVQNPRLLLMRREIILMKILWMIMMWTSRAVRSLFEIVWRSFFFRWRERSERLRCVGGDIYWVNLQFHTVWWLEMMGFEEQWWKSEEIKIWISWKVREFIWLNENAIFNMFYCVEFIVRIFSGFCGILMRLIIKINFWW